MRYLMLFVFFLPMFINSMDVPNFFPVFNQQLRLNQQLLSASVSGDRHLDRIRTLLNAGADVNYVINGGDGFTPLERAAAGAQLGTIEMLLARGANPNLETRKGITPLSSALDAYGVFHFIMLGGGNFAIKRQIVGSIALLIRAGADVNHPSVKRIIELYPQSDLRIVLKQAQEIAKGEGPQKLR